MAAVTAVPTLSAIQTWDTTHLEHAAASWSGRAWQWENSFAAVYDESLHPGGTTWHGEGADAATARAAADRIVVTGMADRLHAAARIARDGAEDIATARRAALDAIATARSMGFTVTEALSVIPPPSSGLLHQAQLQTQSQMLAGNIRARAAELLDADVRVAGQIHTATMGLADVQFSTLPVTPPASKKPSIQAVDYHDFKQAPVPGPGTPDDPASPTGPPGGADIQHVLDGLPSGDKPHIKEVRTPQDLQRLWEWAKQNGTEIPNGYGDHEGTRYRLPDGTTIGQRPVAGSNGLPVVDINNVPDGDGYTKVHINPRGGIPDIPATVGEPAPAPAAPRVPPPPATEPVTPKPPPTEGGLRGIGGAPITPPGPTFVPPPHSIHHLPVLGEDDLEAPWEYEP